MNEACEVDCSAVIAGGDAAEVLELREASFDPVARLVSVDVVVELKQNQKEIQELVLRGRQP